jgi:hypothetical protein
MQKRISIKNDEELRKLEDSERWCRKKGKKSKGLKGLGHEID